MSESFAPERLYYIRTRGADDKRPLDKWGGYGQDFDEAQNVYDYEEMQMMPDDHWAVVGVRDRERMPLATLVFDLDVHEAPGDFDADKLGVPSNTLLVRSQSGGFHLYFTVNARQQDYNESDFGMTKELGWDIDIRGSAVGAHVVAPGDIPGVDTPYEVVQNEPIKNVLDPADAAERITYDGEPLLEFDATAKPNCDIDIDRNAEPPEEMPTCYHRGLQLRNASPEDHPNSHKVNVATALCGLYAGYGVDALVDHFMEFSPDAPDREKTEYQVNHLAEHVESDDYSPPAISTLRNLSILDEDETCDCDIPYHGGDGEDVYEQTWEWWSHAREHGNVDETSIIPDAALWHIAAEHTGYPTQNVEDVDELPPAAARRALNWLENIWPLEADVDVDPNDDDSSVTERRAPSMDADAVHTWSGVRMVYEEHDKKNGRDAAARLLLDRHDYMTPMDTETLWVYDPDRGIYEPNGEAHVKTQLVENLSTFHSQREESEIIAKLEARSFVERDEFNAEEDANLVCVGNGVLDISEEKLNPHSPDYYFTRGIRWDYDPEAEAPEIDSFLEKITSREADKKTLVEMVGASLSSRYEYGKFLILFGEGSNGKSTFFDVVENLLGEENVAGWGLQQLSDNRFSTSDLVGKFANVAPDMPGKKLQEVGTLKTLTGGDQTMAEKKGEGAFPLKNNAALMFGANRPPAIPESSKAVRRRLVPIRFKQEFTNKDDGNPDKRDKQQLMSEMTTPEEMSGFLNMAVAGLRRLRNQQDVSLPESGEERLEYYEQFSDPIKEFRVTCLENAQGTREKKEAVYDAYTRFCRENDYDPSDKRVFWRQLPKTTLTVDQSRPEIAGERTRVLNNVKFTESGLDYARGSMLIDEPHSDEPEETNEIEEKSRPLTDIDPDKDEGTYVSVTAVVTKDTKESGLSDSNRPVIKAEARDETGTADLVTWNEHADAANPNAPLSPWPEIEAEDGQAVYCDRVRVGGEYDDRLQLVMEEGVSSAQEIQHGVGYTEPVDPDDADQTGLDKAADGGQTDDIVGARGRVHNHLKTQYETDDELSPAEVAGQIQDLSPDDVIEALESLKQQGEVADAADGQYRVL